MIKALALSLILCATLHADTQREVQDLAHIGAGFLVSSGVHFLDHSASPSLRAILEIGAAFTATEAYEIMTRKPPAIASERDICGTVAGVIFVYSWRF